MLVFPKKAGARDPCERSELEFDVLLAGASSLKYISASAFHKALGFDSYACFPPSLLSIVRLLSSMVLLIRGVLEALPDARSHGDDVVNIYIDRCFRKVG